MLRAELETSHGVVMTEQDAAQWYIARDGKQTGPMSGLEIKAIAAHNYFRATDLVWRPGLAEWQPALSLFPPAPPPAMPPALPQPPPASAAAHAQPARLDPAPMRRDPTPQLRDLAPRDPINRAPSAATGVREPISRDAVPRTPGPSQIAQTLQGPAAAQPALAPQPQAHPSLTPHPSAPQTQAPQAPYTPLTGDPADRSAPRAPQPQSPSDQARLPVSPPYREPTARPTQPPYRQEPAHREMANRDEDAARAPQPREPVRDASLSARRPLATVEAHTEFEAAAPVAPTKSRRGLMLAIATGIIAVSGGIWSAANPGLFKGLIGGLPAAHDVMASSQATLSPPRDNNSVATAGTSDLDARWQQSPHWQVLKREFPDWYGDRLRETAKSVGENKSDGEINKSLTDQMIALRRQNATLALSASTPKLKALANAFLNNLRQLKEQSTTACFNFISQGEATPGLLDQFGGAASRPSAMQAQVAAIFDAIADGRRLPVSHDKPQKADYDTLMAQLAKLGWSQTDVATFADPKALARAEPARVCQMVQDWFVAHISIADETTQERLLGETLRPVVSG